MWPFTRKPTEAPAEPYPSHPDDILLELNIAFRKAILTGEPVLGELVLDDPAHLTPKHLAQVFNTIAHAPPSFEIGSCGCCSSGEPLLDEGWAWVPITCRNWDWRVDRYTGPDRTIRVSRYLEPPAGWDSTYPVLTISRASRHEP